MARGLRGWVLWLLLVPLVLPFPGFAEPVADGQFLILLTNDDGYDAPGLRALAQELAPLGQVIVAAPQDNQSGTGHGTTSRSFIRARAVEILPGVSAYAIAARPATCVRLGIEALVPRKPDLVVSGINRGLNLGIVTYYSGTLGAAREAAFVGIPAIAVSMGGNEATDYEATAAFVRGLVEKLREGDHLKPGLFLSVNAPRGSANGVRVTRQSTTPTGQTFQPYTNPRGETYYWSDYQALPDDEEGTDVWAVVRGYIAVTPLKIDGTASADLDWLRNLIPEPAAAPVP